MLTDHFNKLDQLETVDGAREVHRRDGAAYPAETPSPEAVQAQHFASAEERIAENNRRRLLLLTRLEETGLTRDEEAELGRLEAEIDAQMDVLPYPCAGVLEGLEMQARRFGYSVGAPAAISANERRRVVFGDPRS